MAEFTRYFKDVLDTDPTIKTDILDKYPLFAGLPTVDGVPYRDALNSKIIDHYFNHEIGMENESMFRLALKRKLNEIMPIYNEQYRISQIEFDPLRTMHITTTTTQATTATATDESTNNSTSSAESRAVASDFPQVRLAGDKDYATAAQDNISGTSANGTANTSQHSNQENSGDSETTGFQGNPAMMIYEYRQTLVNIDMMIINELQTLFMLIWSTGDEYTNGVPYYAFYRGYGFSI